MEDIDLLKKRLLAKRVIDPITGCWLWPACRSPMFYGTVLRYINGKSVKSMVHRTSYEVFVGPIPKGLLVCHKCDVRKCFNPEHLFVGTHKDNMQDAARKGRTARNARRLWTHCSHGHEYTPENTSINTMNRRVCLTCQRTNGRNAYWRNLEKSRARNRAYHQRKREAYAK